MAFDEKAHEWAATAAKLIIIGKSSEVVDDLHSMPKKKGLLYLATLLSYQTGHLDRHGAYHKFTRALMKKS